MLAPCPRGFWGGRFSKVHKFVCAPGAGQVHLGVQVGEVQGGEGLSVPGNILVHVLLCWVRICHGVLCFWGILSVPVWVFAGFINLHPLGLFMSLRSRSSGVFQYWGPLCTCLASLKGTDLDGTFLVLLPDSSTYPKPHLSPCLYQSVWLRSTP